MPAFPESISGLLLISSKMLALLHQVNQESIKDYSLDLETMDHTAITVIA